MSAWGTGLYQDDTAIDIRDTVKDELRLGKSLNAIINKLKQCYDIGKYENNYEEPVFWCVLADTLWNLGRLDDTIKKTALCWIDRGGDVERWEFEDVKLANKRKAVFVKLKEKLVSPQPPEKKISRLHLYSCQWNIGDVFAMKLNGQLAEERGLIDTYLLFQVADKYLYSIFSDKTMGHLCPIVRTKLTFTDITPTLDDFDENNIIIQDNPCEATKGKTIYTTLIYTTSSRAIPKNLKYLGNKKVIVPKDDYGIFFNTFDICNNMNFVLWKRFELSMIENYFGHNLKEYEFYKDLN